MEETDEDNNNEPEIFIDNDNNNSTNAKDTNISGNDISSMSSNDNNKNLLKMPLMERLKRKNKNMKIDGMSSFNLTSFGKKA